MIVGGFRSSPQAGGAPRNVGQNRVGGHLLSPGCVLWVRARCRKVLHGGCAVLLCSMGDRFLLEATNISESREAIFKQRKH